MKALTYTFSFMCILGVAVGLYIVTLRSVWGNVDVSRGSELTAPTAIFESSHDRAPYALMLSLDEENTFYLSKKLAEFGSPDVGVYQDKFYILFPPGMSLYAYPFFKLGKLVGMSHLFSVGSVILLAVGSFIFIWLIAKKIFMLPVWEAMLAGFVFSFGTTSWGYATTLYQHIPTTFLILVAFYSAWKYKQRGKYSVAWSAIVWLAYGFGIFIDLPNILLLAPIMLYFVLSSLSLAELKTKYALSFRLSIIISSIVFLVLLAVHAYYNIVAFGDWRTYGQTLTRYEGEQKYLAKLDLRAREATLSGELKKKSSSVLKEEHIVNGLYRLTVADDKGLFIFSPIMVLGVLGFLLKRKDISSEYSVVIAVVLVNVFIYASFSDVWGGWAYGPQYLIPSMALLGVGVSLFVSCFRFQLLGRFIFLGFFAYSAAIALLGVLTTNAVPPGVEAKALGVKSNYLYSLDYFNLGKTGSIVYHTWFSSLPLATYAIYIYCILLGTVAILTFIPYLFRLAANWRKV